MLDKYGLSAEKRTVAQDELVQTGWQHLVRQVDVGYIYAFAFQTAIQQGLSN